MVELPSQLLGYIDPEFQKIALMSALAPDGERITTAIVHADFRIRPPYRGRRYHKSGYPSPET